nr:sigma-70 family RNA polymerase sigma factor [uncultured Anaerotignum sp.]
MIDQDKLNFLEKIYMEEVPNMLRYAEILLSSYLLTEDAVQNTFKIALEKIDNVINSPKPVGWIKNTLKNEIRQKYREQKKWQKYIFDYELNMIPVHDALSVETAFWGLDENAIYLLKKIYVEGIPYQELAKELNISVSALKMRIKRAKDKLKKELT